jgi:hypothetical protein
MRAHFRWGVGMPTWGFLESAFVASDRRRKKVGARRGEKFHSQELASGFLLQPLVLRHFMLVLCN